MRILNSYSFPLGITNAAQAALTVVDANKHLNIFTALHPAEKILAASVNAEKRAVDGGVGKLSELDGRLVAIKDNIVTTDLPTSCGSEMLREYVSPFDATVVARLRSAGCTIMGKTNMDEFGMGSHSTFSIHGAVQRPRYPWREPRSAGGSSGGSAAAVAAGMCHVALGTDTGGSVRLPASYCGVVGFKPSYGLLSRWGVVAYANSLDTVSILARNTLDAKIVFKLLNAYDPNDPTSATVDTRERVGKSLGALHEKARVRRCLRIGVPAEYNVAELSPLVRRSWEKTLRLLALRGAEIVPVSLPNTRAALAAYYILAPAEASSNLARYDGLRYGHRSSADRSEEDNILFAPTRAEGFGPEVRRRILLGAYTLSSEAIGNYFLKAQRVRRLVQRDFDKVFAQPNFLVQAADTQETPDGVDAIIAPAALGVAPKLADIENQRPVEAYANDVLTVPASLAGIPCISVPVGEEANEENDGEGGMVGMQVMCQWGDEERLWEVARLIENDSDAKIGKGARDLGTVSVAAE
ncbi:Glutamyl-tRNA amidotransferase subunit A, mitochondrial [Tricharina praecox]|uniref:Glutamyl-tRNA amidotransferase subunit A, mitochondrial n=1 Tax=Tricharina praecox TaxID=43433 RepID=UPI002220F98B|nr:Glutamyl-tRNA amidotransferase subunit A, mitochondrial [Tricharina praecox]KAI5843609.1 Glutamyl-tRNA amidotransferase subunit A, mitochondrial [Tricharina praecox]